MTKTKKAVTPATTHLTIIVDRTGSMSTMQVEAETALNNFIADQRKVGGEATLLFLDFDSEAPYNLVFDGNLSDMEKYTLEPRSMTPLYDAVGNGIMRTVEKVRDLKPERTFVVILTDGHENASKEWRLDRVIEAIKRHEEEGWEFIFLASGRDAWNAAAAFVGTRMVQTNTVTAAGSSAAYYAGTQTISDTMADSRLRGVTHTYGAAVADDGTVTKEDDANE